MRKKRRSEDESALVAALRMLSRRSYSEGEVREKLYSKGHPAQEIERTVSRLKELGYVNDGELAEQIVRYRFTTLGHGQRKIVQYLKRRKIPDEIISRAVDLFVSKEKSVTRGVDLLRKRNERREFDISSEKGKIFRYLAGRGFTVDEIREIISEYERTLRGEDEG